MSFEQDQPETAPLSGDEPAALPESQSQPQSTPTPRTTEWIRAELAKPVPPTAKYERSGGRSGMLTYIKEDYQVDELNRIFGEENWGNQLISQQPILSDSSIWRAHVRIVAKMGKEVITHDGTGTCGQGNMKGADGIEMACKGAETDAFKRAARKFGKRLGNGLYTPDVDSETDPRTGQYTPPQNYQQGNQNFQQRQREPQVVNSPQEVMQHVNQHVNGARQQSNGQQSTQPLRGSYAEIERQRAAQNNPQQNYPQQQAPQQDVIECPKCYSPMQDQRGTSYYGNGIAKSGKPKPILRCSNRDCDAAEWPKGAERAAIYQTAGVPDPDANRNGHGGNNGNGNNFNRQQPVHSAHPNQLKAINEQAFVLWGGMADQSLASTLVSVFGTGDLNSLSSEEAGQFIDHLNELQWEMQNQVPVQM